MDILVVYIAVFILSSYLASILLVFAIPINSYILITVVVYVINPWDACTRGVMVLARVSLSRSVCYHSSSGIVHFYAQTTIFAFFSSAWIFIELLKRLTVG